MSLKKIIANILVRIPGFEESDTNSQREGFLEPGKYFVLEYLKNHLTPDTDYARIEAPALGAGDTWICTRWKNQKYAEISEIQINSTARITFTDESLSIPEYEILNVLNDFREFTYDLDEARYPFKLPGLNLPQSPPNSNNCCTFVEALLVKAWANVFDHFTWNSDRHGQMMILSSDDFFSPVTAAIDSGMAIAVHNPDTLPHPWTIIQGWRQQWRSGHTFLIVDHHEPSDRVLTLESNSSYKLNGVGFRAIGNLRDFNSTPPDNWWDREDLWTWKRICSTYRFRQHAWLKVKDRKWSNL